MLFNSLPFIFWFLPIVLFGFFVLGRYQQKLAVSWLVIAAFFFYGFWNPKYTTLLIISIIINYFFGAILNSFKESNQAKKAKLFLAIAIIIDLGILFYFKYSNFFLSSVDVLTGKHYFIKNLLLPLGISFFTFTQIAFLVDVYQKKVKDYNPLYYFLFVTYFPHLIAGPIIHHAEMMPQFLNPKTYKFNLDNFTIGTLIFLIGLAKKVLLADHLATYADSIFNASSTHQNITFYESWIGALAYTFQLYFDFSGYSDMAIGLSKMLNIQLPVNFNSPYKSQSIIDFWRRWHITLSRFLRDYLYIPLGGNKYGDLNRYRNLLITMLLGGLWHGASWTFIIWGGLHGTYLAMNHLWQGFMKKSNLTNITNFKIYQFFGWFLTFLAVVIAWVFFRADSIDSAFKLLHSMSTIKIHSQIGTLIPDYYIFGYLILSMTICFLLPNTQQIFAQYKPALTTYPDDITPKQWLNRINWLQFFKPKLPRYLTYIGISYIVCVFSMMLFYYDNLDAKILSHFPNHLRPAYGVDIQHDDYRSNLFINNIFLGKERKIIIVGSSYTSEMGTYTFTLNGIAYKSGTIGNGGNTLSNGFRAATAVLQNFPIDTLIFGVSPLGFGEKNSQSSIFFKDECLGPFNNMMLGGNHYESFKECSPFPIKLRDLLRLATNPADPRFFQYQGFLSKLEKYSLINSPATKPTVFSLEKVEELNDWYGSIVQQKSTNPISPDQKNGADATFFWLHRSILESLADKGDMFIAFQQLKRLADSKGVRLVVYNTPTVSSKDAPYIYPPGFLEAYQSKLSTVMNKLGITYYDLTDEMIWDKRYTYDFVHLIPKGRERIHALLIKYIFFKEKDSEPMVV